MNYYGTFRLGEEAVFSISTVDGTGSITTPSDSPILDIWSATQKVLSGIKVPAVDRRAVAGLFRIPIMLDERFAVGDYTLRFNWIISGQTNTAEGGFSILDGGDPNGSVISMYCYERPNARYLVHQTDTGRIFKGKNPRF